MCQNKPTSYIHILTSHHHTKSVSNLCCPSENLHFSIPIYHLETFFFVEKTHHVHLFVFSTIQKPSFVWYRQIGKGQSKSYKLILTISSILDLLERAIKITGNIVFHLIVNSDGDLGVIIVKCLREHLWLFLSS